MNIALPIATSLSHVRVRQLVIGVLCLVVVSNLQYAWTLFVEPMSKARGWSRADIQWAFFYFIFVQTWLVPFEAYFIDRFGPRWMVFGGAFLVGFAWITNAYAFTLTMLYAGAVVGGIGSGIILGAVYGNVVKWFRYNRGLAAGLTAAGYGAGSVVTVIPIGNTIAAYGYQSAFLYFGLGQGALLMVLALYMQAPKEQLPAKSEKTLPQTLRQYHPKEVLKTPVFWIMYAMFAIAAGGGLMITAQMGPLAADFKIAQMPVTILGLTENALYFSLILERIMNGVSRPVFGFVSDKIGREVTMGIAFTLEAVGVYLLATYAHDPLLFVLFGGLVFFAWGEIYSIFPAICTDIFGIKFSSTNYGMLYTAKGAGALMVPLASVIKDWTGSWSGVFMTVVSMDILVAFMAVIVLWPLRREQQRA